MPSSVPIGRQPCIALATCRRWPALSLSDQRYAAALRSLGAKVETAAWNVEADQPAFHRADLVVIRGTWDYHDDVDAYQTWLIRLRADGVRLLNDIDTIIHFLDKRAFMALARDGVTTPACHDCPADSDAIADVLSTEGWDKAVLKPVNGASGRGVQLVTPQTVHAALADVIADVGVRDLLVQQFIPEVAEGETQFILFDGTVSHAVSKRPRAGEFRTNSVFAPEITLLDPLPAAAECIEALIRDLAILPLYARVDVIMQGAVPMLLEFEVNEPGLWLDVTSCVAAETFARATLARLER